MLCKWEMVVKGEEQARGGVPFANGTERFDGACSKRDRRHCEGDAITEEVGLARW